VAALQAAHEAVGAAADGTPTGRDGDHAVVATLAGSTALVAHVGDSRAYLLDSDGRLQQVTRGPRHGRLHHPGARLDRGVDRTWSSWPPRPQSRLLLCSDGLSNMVDAADIGALLGSGDAAAACDSLVEAALDRGGIDNVTVVVVAF
jgi:protein phosphatase